jgi:hypothetical protein
VGGGCPFSDGLELLLSQIAGEDQDEGGDDDDEEEEEEEEKHVVSGEDAADEEGNKDAKPPNIDALGWEKNKNKRKRTKHNNNNNNNNNKNDTTTTLAAAKASFGSALIDYHQMFPSLVTSSSSSSSSSHRAPDPTLSLPPPWCPSLAPPNSSPSSSSSSSSSSFFSTSPNKRVLYPASSPPGSPQKLLPSAKRAKKEVIDDAGSISGGVRGKGGVGVRAVNGDSACGRKWCGVGVLEAEALASSLLCDLRDEAAVGKWAFNLVQGLCQDDVQDDVSVVGNGSGQAAGGGRSMVKHATTRVDGMRKRAAAAKAAAAAAAGAAKAAAAAAAAGATPIEVAPVRTTAAGATTAAATAVNWQQFQQQELQPEDELAAICTGVLLALRHVATEEFVDSDLKARHKNDVAVPSLCTFF